MHNRKLAVIISQVYRKNVKSWTFFFMVAAPLIFLLIFSGIILFMNKESDDASYGNIAVIMENEVFKSILAEAEPRNIYQYDLSIDQAKEKLEADEIDGYLVIEETGQQIQPTYYRKTTSKDMKLYAITDRLSQFQLDRTTQNLGLTEDQVEGIQQANIDMKIIQIEKKEDGTIDESDADDIQNTFAKGIAYFVSILVFIFIMNYLGIISQEIAAEKGYRIMEIILSSVPAKVHFLGKIIGIVLVILTQLAIYTLVGLIGFIVFKQLDILTFLDDHPVVETWQANQSNLIYSIVFAILGMMMYICVSAFLGSLVSKTEDVPKSIQPIVWIGVAGFYIAMFALGSPNNALVRWGSQFPLFTAFIMPHRLASKSVDQWELWLAIGLNIAFLLATFQLAASFYESNVLSYSEKGMIANFKQSYQNWSKQRK